jgi:hypothetical protein
MRLNDLPPHLRPRESKPRGRKPVSAERGPLLTHMLHIEGWHPARNNQWHGSHWAVRARLKKADRERVALHAGRVGVPHATGKRRVTLTITLGPRQRGGDPDAYWKACLDSLVSCGLLVDDNRQGVELAPVRFGRAKVKATTILLEDVE